MVTTYYLFAATFLVSLLKTEYILLICRISVLGLTFLQCLVMVIWVEISTSPIISYKVCDKLFNFTETKFPQELNGEEICQSLRNVMKAMCVDRFKN